VKIAVAMCSALVGLVIVEGAARFLAPAYDPGGRVIFTLLPDGTPIGPPGVTRRLAKNTGDYDVQVRFNSLGFRDSKSIQTSGVDSIFVVGDSFGFGWGVDESQRFSNVLSDRLGRLVFNISAGAADFDGYGRLVHYAEANGARIGTLIVSVCMENDLREYGPEDSTRTARPSVSGAKAYLTEHSAVYGLVTAAIHRTPWIERAAERTGLLVPNLAAVAESDASEASVKSSAERLRRLVAGRRAVILIVPSRGLWVGTDVHRRQVARTHETFVGLLRRARLQVVDVRAMFEQQGSPLSLHFANDGHWTAAGHRIAADALAHSITAAPAAARGSVSTSDRRPAR
jgi:SGNH hydrolase-like domain, acetyltransferase AlgX